MLKKTPSFLFAIRVNKTLHFADKSAVFYKKTLHGAALCFENVFICVFLWGRDEKTLADASCGVRFDFWWSEPSGFFAFFTVSMGGIGDFFSILRRGIKTFSLLFVMFFCGFDGLFGGFEAF